MYMCVFVCVILNVIRYIYRELSQIHVTNISPTEDIRWWVVRSRFDISNRCENEREIERGFVEQMKEENSTWRNFENPSPLRDHTCIYTYMYMAPRERSFFFFFIFFLSVFLLLVYRVELIGWTVKHTEFSVARQSFPGPRECTPRNRAAAVRTPPRGASPPLVPVAASCSSLSPCSEVSLCELWI